MDATGPVQASWIDSESASDRADAALRSWDWRKTMKAQERTVPWLARHTTRSQSTVYKYSYGILTPPVEWLRNAARALGHEVAA